jgi:hypothetical protein
MEKRWGLTLVVGLLITCGAACGEPKQAWERPREPTAAAEQEPTAAAYEPPAVEASEPKEPSHEDVCRKMWTLIEVDATKAAKKKGKKGPTDKDRSEFLKDCFARGGDEQKANPQKYKCQRTCIMDAQLLADVETCGKECS